MTEQTLAGLKNSVAAFNGIRKWMCYNTAKNMSMALGVECGELLSSIDSSPSSADKAVGHEIADLFFILLEFAAIFDVDISDSVKERMNSYDTIEGC